jgi:hypothetical protein
MPPPTPKLTFSPSPVVLFGGNRFIDVPVILQVGPTPIVETVKGAQLDRLTQFSIYNADGVYLAKVVGPRLFLTKDGEKSQLSLQHPPLMTVCKLGASTLFEVRRDAAAGVAISAELYSPEGLFIKAPASIPVGTFSKDGTRIGGAVFQNNTLNGIAIGFWISPDGRRIIFGAKRNPDSSPGQPA